MRNYLKYILPIEKISHPRFLQDKQNICEGNASLLNQNSKLDSKSKNRTANFDFTNKNFDYISFKNVKERHFICDYCSKKCLVKKHLISHIRTHTKERPFICKFCSKSYLYKGNLVGHVRMHTLERPYKCNYCSKSFSYLYSRKIHTRIHTQEKPYKCDYCNKTFSDKSNCNKHIRRHTK